jgi:hypothetical protein
LRGRHADNGSAQLHGRRFRAVQSPHCKTFGYLLSSCTEPLCHDLAGPTQIITTASALQFTPSGIAGDTFRLGVVPTKDGVDGEIA